MAESTRAERPRSRPRPVNAPALGQSTARGGGDPLPGRVAQPISASLGVDVSPVRVHSDSTAAGAAHAFGARAFTFGTHVFLGRGQRATDLPLMAHEVAHVVQQQGAPRLQTFTAGGTDSYEREAHGAATAVTRRERFAVRLRTRPIVQRLGLSDALDYFADKANLIPGFRMFTVVLGINPINMSRVERTPANVLRALIELIPGGALITQALDNHGVFEKVGTWVEQQLRTLGMTGSLIRKGIDQFLSSLSWTDIFHLGSVWDRAKRIFTEPITRIIDFGASLVVGILKFIKDAILRPLAKLAEGKPGYDLLKAVLGEDPITGEKVPRTPETLIGGFMKLIGQEEIWENLKRANAVSRAWTWFQGVLSGVLAFVRALPGMFLSAIRELEIADIVLLPRAFLKIARVFGGFVGSFFSWAGQQVLGLLQIIFEVLAPKAMPYLRKAAGAFRQIVADPIRFIGNLVRAGILGFKQFAGNFLSHLRASLIQWLTGTLAGANIYIPQAFELREIVKFVLSVLGLTWDNVRGKLVKVIGDTAVKALETGLDIVVTLVKEGPAAAWEKIREQLSNLKEMVMEQVMTFVRESIVQAAITRLLTSLNPAGAFIQAVIAIYNTVMFFIERLNQIAQVAMSFIDSVSEIAAGGIGSAAKRVETTMAGLLTLVISFLARIVGLGKVSEQVVKIVNKIRAPIDKALDKVIEWIVSVAKRLVATGRAAVSKALGWWKATKRFRPAGGASHEVGFRGEGTAAVVVVRSQEQAYRDWLNRLKLPAGDTKKADAKKAATDTLAAMESLKVRNLPDGERTAQFDALLSTLAAATQELMSAGPPPESTPPIYGGASAGGFATSMDVSILTSKGPAGTPPAASLSGPVWDVLAKRYETPGSSRRFYKLGHLLSYRVHGPGDTFSNLTPQSESSNATFERRVESGIKKLVDKGTGLRYAVRAVYARGAGSKAAIAQIWKKRNEPRINEKLAILDAEEKVPVALTYEYQVVFENGAPVQGGSPTTASITNPIRQDANSYHLK